MGKVREMVGGGYGHEGVPSIPEFPEDPNDMERAQTNEGHQRMPVSRTKDLMRPQK